MEQQTVSLKQCISEITGKQIAMNRKDFIYLDDKTKVEDEIITEATKLKTTKENSLKNQEIQDKIDSLEKTLIRPLRELLSTSTSDETKNTAQTKVDEIEAQIETLRSQILS